MALKKIPCTGPDGRSYNESMTGPKSKILTAVFFFTLGYLVNGLVGKMQTGAPTTIEGVERYPVDPDDFDTRKMIEAINEERGGWGAPMDAGASLMGEISQREDDKFVYYEIPLNKEANANHELKVEVKNDVIHIVEVLKDGNNPLIETNAERMFTIDPSLDSSLAEVINEKNKVLIKIPKRRI